jgi:ring-1,2-phenylacetyl-CoA epoxidase subunit PaaE
MVLMALSFSLRIPMNDFLKLRVKAVVQETAEARTYVLENTEGPPPVYQSGQFLTLLLQHAGKEVRRSYSLVSAPGIDPDLAITIKRVINGEISRHLLSTLRVGDIIHALYPAGRFTLETNAQNQRDIFLIGGGSGITPLFSLLKTILRTEPSSHITLINSNKNRDTALFWDQLQELERQYPRQLTGIHLFSDPSPEWKHYRGRLENSLLEKLVNENLVYRSNQAEFLICGPSTLMRMARITLIFMGFPQEAIHKENFITDLPATVPVQALDDGITRRVNLWYRGQEYHLEVPPHQTILQTALNAGITLPYSCRAGMCANCAGICTQGSVHMTINEVLTSRDLAKGWVLTCVGYPQTEEVTITFPT